MSESFFKKVPYRQAHPNASTDYDGYYAIVPRSNRCSRRSPGGKTVERIARSRGISFEQAVKALQYACDERVRQLVAKDVAARRAKAKRVRNRKGKKPNGPNTMTVGVVTVTRTYVDKNGHERKLIREVVTRERNKLLVSDYRAFPFRVALSIHRAGGDGLSVKEVENV